MELAAQAAEDAAWTELQRCTAWWLGEFVNTAAGEVAGQRPADREEEDGGAEDTAGLSAAETLVLKVVPSASMRSGCKYNSNSERPSTLRTNPAGAIFEPACVCNRVA